MKRSREIEKVSTKVKIEPVGRRRDGIQVWQAEIPHITTGRNRFQVLDVARGQIVVEARTRRAAEQRLVNYLLSGRFRIMRKGVWQDPPNYRQAMPVKVLRTDGRKETIELREPLTVQIFSDGSTILKSGWLDHFFLPDGKYSGYGSNTSNANANKYERNRKVED